MLSQDEPEQSERDVGQIFLNTGRPSDRLRRLTVGDVDEGRSVEGFHRALDALGDVQRVDGAGVPPGAEVLDRECHIRFVSGEEAVEARRHQRPRTRTASSRARGRRRPSPSAAAAAALPTVSLPGLRPTRGPMSAGPRPATPEMLARAGEQLRATRTALGLSLDDVFRRTHIPVRTLEAIEEGRSDGLHAPVYARGFVRTYARALGLDEDAVLGRDVADVAVPLPAPKARRREPRERRERRVRPRQVLAVAAAVLAIVATAVVLTREGDDPTVRAEAPADERSTPPPTAAGKPAKKKPAAPAPPAVLEPSAQDGRTFHYATGAPALEIALTASGDCWVRISDAGGRDVFTGVLHPTDQRTVPASSPVTVRLGNPGGAAVSVNGRPLAVPAPPGQPVDLVLAA